MPIVRLIGWLLAIVGGAGLYASTAMRTQRQHEELLKTLEKGANTQPAHITLELPPQAEPLKPPATDTDEKRESTFRWSVTSQAFGGVAAAAIILTFAILFAPGTVRQETKNAALPIMEFVVWTVTIAIIPMMILYLIRWFLSKFKFFQKEKPVSVLDRVIAGFTVATFIVSAVLALDYAGQAMFGDGATYIDIPTATPTPSAS